VDHRELASFGITSFIAFMGISAGDPPREHNAFAAPRETSVTNASSAPKSVVRHRYVVAAIGDSITDAHTGGGKYLRDLAARCPNSRFDNYGIGGQFAHNMHDRFDKEIFGPNKPEYTHVIVFGGINDMIGGVARDGLERVENHLAAMYESGKARGVSVVALTVPLFGPHTVHEKRMTDALDAWILEQANDDGDVAHAVDIRVPLICEDLGTLCRPYRKWPVDTVHWSKKGHEVVADAIWREVFPDCE
jgi:lysophospholipase L1-like esterase